ncbi:hypothetical protein E2E30_17770 [Sphingomonas sp. AAP5]|uniref:hypothetical protein n=1 Tax=Sphingomonas sp. AAP5 TaxID=1523415 RepID=UPI0010570078|nr:hypothetical protein [Sphingomonas sp. AAP5]QBM77409.1 hypothetical protein E2E30_17770 [Sphingomonas sp. AAP5]
MPFSGSDGARGDGGNPRLPNAGTQAAIYNTSKSARHRHGKSACNGWGGSRNRADRCSEGLTAKQVEGIEAAAQTAWRRGLAFNCHVTIHWAKLGVADDATAAATGAFLTCARDCLRKQGLPFAYAYVRENSGDNGAHSHILAHLPPGTRWAFQRSKRWLERISGKPYFTGGIRTHRIRGTGSGRVILPDLYAENLAEVVGYLTKGALPSVAAALALERVKFGGRVIGKRSGCSENVGSRASNSA